MRAENLTRKQCQVLFDRVPPLPLYLAKLDKCKAHRRLSADDPLGKLVANARAAVYDLRQELR
jgi:hypothetical protein